MEMKEEAIASSWKRLKQQCKREREELHCSANGRKSKEKYELSKELLAKN